MPLPEESTLKEEWESGFRSGVFLTKEDVYVVLGYQKENNNTQNLEGLCDMEGCTRRR